MTQQEPRTRATSPIRWTEKLEKLVKATADGATREESAREAGLSEATVARYRRHPEFRERVEQRLEETRAELKAEGVARRQNRMDGYNARITLLGQVIAERAADPDFMDVPGYKTGLLVRDAKRTGMDDYVNTFAVDTGLLAEMRAIEKQAAQDVGQWTEKQEHSGEMILRQYVGIDVDKV